MLPATQLLSDTLNRLALRVRVRRHVGHAQPRDPVHKETNWLLEPAAVASLWTTPVPGMDLTHMLSESTGKPVLGCLPSSNRRNASRRGAFLQHAPAKPRTLDSEYRPQTQQKMMRPSALRECA